MSENNIFNMGWNMIELIKYCSGIIFTSKLGSVIILLYHMYGSYVHTVETLKQLAFQKGVKVIKFYPHFQLTCFTVKTF